MADVPNAAKEFADQIRGELVATKQALQTELMKSLDERDSRLVEKLGKQFADQRDEFIQKMNAQQGAFRVPGLTPDSKEVKEFDLGRLVKGMAMGRPGVIAPLETEMCLAAAEATDPEVIKAFVQSRGEVVTKDQLMSLDSAGGFVVPNQVYASQIIPILSANVISAKLGMRRLSGLMGSPVTWPRITADVDMEEVGESEAPAGDDLAFGNINLTPHEMAQTVTISNRLLQQSPANIEQLIRTRLIAAAGRKIDAWALTGTGSNGQPVGLFNATDVNSVTSFADLDATGAYDKLNTMIYEIAADNAGVYTSKPKWAFNPIHTRDLRNIKDPTDSSQPKQRRLLDAPAATAVLGFEFEESTTVPSDKFAFGYWESVLIGEWGTFMLAASNQAGNTFTKRQTIVLGCMLADIGFEHPQALCIATGVTQT